MWLKDHSFFLNNSQGRGWLAKIFCHGLKEMRIIFALLYENLKPDVTIICGWKPKKAKLTMLSEWEGLTVSPMSITATVANRGFL